MSRFDDPTYVGETVSRSTRTTKEGRDLTYVLRVIQQPERARACGSGAKASADRRPVDPPPVVELRIFEGCFEGDSEIDTSKDITFSYMANFFLFATLEHYRPIAHGRVQGPSAPPVLTGMPVSGMAYLDRPSEAGYFIFPDLSVRHEGKFVLSFNLYEETKESKDQDPEGYEKQSRPQPPMATGTNSSFDWRMEVKSRDFTVFSAKKFPGLAESTSLSRAIAEQGCRVRIRRDVRMRRREGDKPGDQYEEEQRSYSRRTATPESHQPPDRQRSLSNSSASGRVPFDPSRRPSESDYPQHSGPYPYARSPVAQPPSSKTYLDFGSTSNSQYQAPAPQYAPPQQPAASVQPQQSYQSSQSAPYPPPVAYRQPPAPPAYNYDRPSYPPYGSSTTPKRDTFEPEYPRPSGSVSSTSSAAPQYPPIEPSYNRSSFSSSSYPRPQTPVRHETLAPLKNLLEPKLDKFDNGAPLPALNRANRIPPPLPSPNFTSERSSLGHLPTLPLPDSNRNGKRSFDSVFHQPYHSLHNGMRPSSAHYGASSPGSVDDDDYRPMELMTYKRADGSDQTRNFPL